MCNLCLVVHFPMQNSPLVFPVLQFSETAGDRGGCLMLVVGWLVFHGQINSSRLPCLSPPYCHVALWSGTMHLVLWSGTMHPLSGFDATIKLCHHA